MSEIIGYKVGGEVVDTQSYGAAGGTCCGAGESGANSNLAQNAGANAAQNASESSCANGAGEGAIFYDNSPEALHIIRHTAAHVLAAAVRALYPEAKFFVGPAIDDGFYYDIRVEKAGGEKLGEDDLGAIEAKMREIVESKLPIRKVASTKAAVAARYAADDLKQEVLKRIPDGEVSLYEFEGFEDICRGPHLPNTKFARFFKLTRIAGAYLGGDETREMLTRIYGTAYASKDALAEHLRVLEEAKKRDHRRLGVEMGLFRFDEDIGAGLPIWLPQGARMRSRLEHKLYREHRLRGYQPVRGPEILKAQAWKISGHYANYKENMYFTTIDEQEYGIKPMNCVGHIKVYQSQVRSYRDLPLKFFEYGVVHRHEKSGVMHGLFRVREFTQDDAHLFVRPDQIKENVYEILDFVGLLMREFKFDYEMMISTRPAKAVGDDAIWQTATNALKNALDERGLKYEIDEGGGAFYGPKIDIKITDALGRKWQCGTIQVDFNLPARFELGYIDENNERRAPVMLHRAIMGSFERFIGILVEHTAGELPFWLAPTQVGILPVSERHAEYAKRLFAELLKMGVDSEIFDKNETLNKRIRTAEKARIPLLVVVGDSEVESGSVALRDRQLREQKVVSEGEFYELVKARLSEVSF